MHKNEAIFANEAFYLAFSNCDYQAMEDLWARGRAVTCIHPGWPALIDREEILLSWKSILGNPKQPSVSFYEPIATDLNGSVVVSCYEELPTVVLVATNIFVDVGGAPKIMFHQAGICQNAPKRMGEIKEIDS